MANETPQYDFSVYEDGICLLTPITEEAQRWAEIHIEEAPPTWGSAIAIEINYVRKICSGILKAGLTITKDGKEMKELDGDLILV